MCLQYSSLLSRERFYIRTVVAQGNKRGSANVMVGGCRFSLGGNKYLMSSFSRSGNDAKRDVEFREFRLLCGIFRDY